MSKKNIEIEIAMTIHVTRPADITISKWKTHHFNVYLYFVAIHFIPNIGKSIYYSITKYAWVSMSGSMIQKCITPNTISRWIRVVKRCLYSCEIAKFSFSVWSIRFACAHTHTHTQDRSSKQTKMCIWAFVNHKS